jgi:peptide/nickel transport system permease protein
VILPFSLPPLALGYPDRLAETRSLKKSVFIEATEAVGANPERVISPYPSPRPFDHCPQLHWDDTILTAVSGFGVGPNPDPGGVTIAESRQYLPTWWHATFSWPGHIFLVVLGFNMLGDGLRISRPATESWRRAIDLDCGLR